MITPTIHLNGSSADRLLDPVLDAVRKLAAAIEALYEMSPNARDYYVQGTTAFERARDEHLARIRAVSTVREEAVAIAESICDQRDAIEKGKRPAVVAPAGYVIICPYCKSSPPRHESGCPSTVTS